LHDAPDFVWWVPYVLNKRSRIIADVSKRYHKTTHKFGIEVPKSWDNTLCQDMARNEMKNIHIAFLFVIGDEAVLPTYLEIHCHMIFGVKMEDFRHNTHFVAGGHATDKSQAMTYESVVS
jgi:hypothetical protein